MFDRLFYPRGVVVIGASQNPTKLGYIVARNLVESKYQGELHFVNPRSGRLFDRPTYSDLTNVPDPVDLAVILIPACHVPEALEECGQRGIPFAIIVSSGFKEIGEEGAELEERCLEIANRYGIRILGPNCIGILDTHFPMDTTFLPNPGPIPGDIAFLSHSGAICAAVIDWARGRGLGFSRLVSLGNQMDINETDLLITTAEDDNTRVITMYLESIGDGPRFVEQAKLVTEKKPVIALKVGRSERGHDAVASHTGALAGQDAAFDAAFERAGVIRAHTIEEMFEWAQALAWCPLPKGKRVAVLTNAGGLGVIAMDALGEHGLIPADLEESTVEGLREILPPEANVMNPVDMLASARPSQYADALSILLIDDGVESVIVILPPPPVISAADFADAIIPVVQSTSKPVVIALMGDRNISHASRTFQQAQLPDYRFPERAASALGVLAKRAQQLTIHSQDPIRLDGIDRDKARILIEGCELGTNGFVNPSTASKVLSSYGIGIPEELEATSSEQAVHHAKKIGYPVVMKVNSSDLPHKSDAGGVSLNLQNDGDVASAYEVMMSKLEATSPLAMIDGVLVQKMAKGGQEVIIGAVRDPQFGPLVMFGLGGVEVEGLKDVAFALAPLNRSDAEELIMKTWAGRRLAGYRNIKPVDREAVLDSIIRVGQLAVDFPQIAEVEINPLIVKSEGMGVVAVDVRMKVIEI